MDNEINVFTKGVHNTLDDNVIPKDAASDSENWLTLDGRIVLMSGRYRIGAEGAVGGVYGQIFGYKVNGTKVHWRKIGTKIQYYNGTTWVDTVTGLTDGAEYTFSNYSSLAGTFTFAFGVDGIYKMHNANPGSFINLYDAALNFKGHAFIDRGRTILWNRPEDKTGIYGSWIDRQDSTVYTSIAGEATVSLGGTLAFKAGDADRNCFGVQITLTGTGEVYRDNYDGTLTGSLGGTGTINYITGAYTVTNAGVGTANYQYENSNDDGLTDFTKSATRVAGEGFQFPQDEGGDAIQTVLIGQDGAYYSLKKQSVYRLELTAADTNAENLVYRRDVGVPCLRSAVSTSKGIVFINTANAEKPELTILQRNPLGDNIEPVVLFPHFQFSNYLYTDATLDTFDRYVLVSCRTLTATVNDTILLCDIATGTVDPLSFNARTFAKDGSSLYLGSSASQTVYQLFSGFDDDGFAVSNYWISKGETYKTNRLKKYRKQRFSGRIDPDQYVEVYANYDDAGWQLIGTIRGDAGYVDPTTPEEVGNIIGGSQVGGDLATTVFPFQMEMKLKVPKFQKRKLKIVAGGIGYIDFDNITDHDIFTFENKLPKRFRQKQNVALDGETDDLDNPEF